MRAGSCPAVEDASSRRGRLRPNEQDVIPAVQDGAVGRSRRSIADRSVPARRLRGGPWALRRGRDAADLGVDRRAAGSARSAGAADDVLRAEPAASRRARAPADRELLPVPHRLRRPVRRRQAVRHGVAALRRAGRALQRQDQLQAPRRRRLQAPSGPAGGLEHLRRPVHHRHGQPRRHHRRQRLPGALRRAAHTGTSRG